MVVAWLSQQWKIDTASNMGRAIAVDRRPCAVAAKPWKAAAIANEGMGDNSHERQKIMVSGCYYLW